MAADHTTNWYVNRVGDWRVAYEDDGKGNGNNARIVIRCPWDQSEQRPIGGGKTRTVNRILAGHDLTDRTSAWPQPGHNLEGFRWFIQNLFDRRYLSTAGFLPLVSTNVRDERLNNHGELKPYHWRFRDQTTEPPVERNNVYRNPCKSSSHIVEFVMTAKTRQHGIC